MKRPEQQLQRQLIFWWDIYARTRKIDPRLLMAIPNGGYRTAREGAILKGQGVRAGAPDLFLAHPIYRTLLSGLQVMVPGLWIEMKAGKGRLRASQTDFARILTDECYEVVTCYSFDEAKTVIENYLAGVS